MYATELYLCEMMGLLFSGIYDLIEEALYERMKDMKVSLMSPSIVFGRALSNALT